MNAWSYDYTWPTKANMDLASVFSVGVYPKQIRNGKWVHRPCVVWITGPTRKQDKVLAQVEQTMKELRLGIHSGVFRINVDMKSFYRTHHAPRR